MEQRKIFPRNEEQPLWLPPRFSKFVQTYKHGERHTRNLLAYHDDSDAYAALYLFTFYGRATPVDLNKATGKITANSLSEMSAELFKVQRQEGYEEKMAGFCESKQTDAFYAPIDKRPDNETLMLMIDFAYLYFSIGSANGDYREEAEGQKEQKSSLLVAKNKGLILPGDQRFKMPR